MSKIATIMILIKENTNYNNNKNIYPHQASWLLSANREKRKWWPMGSVFALSGGGDFLDYKLAYIFYLKVSHCY
jgi:hypothetical protein